MRQEGVRSTLRGERGARARTEHTRAVTRGGLHVASSTWRAASCSSATLPPAFVDAALSCTAASRLRAPGDPPVRLITKLGDDAHGEVLHTVTYRYTPLHTVTYRYIP